MITHKTHSRVEMILIIIVCWTRVINSEKVSVQMKRPGQFLLGNSYLAIADDQTSRVDSFLGVPYARPPLGDLRFAKPMPTDDWQGARPAYYHGPSCMQYEPSAIDKGISGLYMWFPRNQSEDCLYLNIYRPAKIDSKLPVLVWIYGGTFTSGSGNLDVYNGEILAAKQKAIVVTFNYRVGIFGFLYFKEERDNKSHSINGNQGLWDQFLALKWVRDNIEAFGGDPSRITLFGESAGAASVSLQYMSPYSTHLFQQMIIQSGSAHARWVLDSTEVAMEKSAFILNHFSCPSFKKNQEASIECLRRIDSKDLIRPEILAAVKSKNRINRIKNNLNVPLAKDQSTNLYFDSSTNPVIDGDFIEGTPEEFFSKKNNREFVKNYIIGSNRNEGMFYLLYYFDMFRKNFSLPNIPGSEDLLKRRLLYDFFPENAFSEEFTNLILTRYKLNDKNMSQAEYLERLDSLCSHLDFTCPTHRFGNDIRSHMGPNNVFMYLFDHRTKALDMPDYVGVMHGYEIEYFFGVPFQKAFADSFYKFTDVERHLSKRIMDYLGNFLRTGDVNEYPSGVKEEEKALYWPKLTDDSENYIKLSNELTIVKDYYQTNCAFWDITLPSFIKILKKFAAYDENKPNFGLKLSNGEARASSLHKLHLILIPLTVWKVMQQ